MSNCLNIDCFKSNVFLEDLKCPICFEIMVNPIIINCKNKCSLGHNCFQKLLKMDGKKCPICNLIFEPGFIKNYKLSSIIEKMEVKCKNKLCSWQGHYNDYIKHCDVCLYEEIICECKVVYVRQDKGNHNRTCPLFSIICTKCLNKVKRKDCLDHEKSCPELDIECEKCRIKLKFKDLEKHILNDCEEVVIDCKYVPYGCNSKNKKRKFINDHVKQNLDDHLEFLEKKMKTTIFERKRDSFESIFMAKDGDTIEIEDLKIVINTENGIYFKSAKPTAGYLVFLAKECEITRSNGAVSKYIIDFMLPTGTNSWGYKGNIEPTEMLHIKLKGIRAYLIPKNEI